MPNLLSSRPSTVGQWEEVIPIFPVPCECAQQSLFVSWLHAAALLVQGFYYANGVALSPDESYVVMAETDMVRVHKVWVKGPKVRPCTG